MKNGGLLICGLATEGMFGITTVSKRDGPDEMMGFTTFLMYWRHTTILVSVMDVKSPTFCVQGARKPGELMPASVISLM